MNNITIAPSLLSADFFNLSDELNSLNALYKVQKNLWLHLDIMDGHFVPNLTFGTPVLKKISNKCHMPLDAHFMVSNPKDYINWFKDLNIHNFTFHIEATDDPMALSREIKKIYPSAGISVNPGTNLEFLTPELIKNIDLLLIMTVEPGFGGQGFIDSTLDKVSLALEMKKKFNPNLTIQVDGGINGETSKKVIEAGADNLVSGSYFFKTDSSMSQKYSSLIH